MMPGMKMSGTYVVLIVSEVSPWLAGCLDAAAPPIPLRPPSHGPEELRPDGIEHADPGVGRHCPDVEGRPSREAEREPPYDVLPHQLLFPHPIQIPARIRAAPAIDPDLGFLLGG